MTEEIWPSFRYGPDEQAQIFERAEDVPAGWADHPSKVNAGKKDDTSERRLPRPELMEALRQRGIQFAPNAGGAELAVLLAASEPQPVQVDSNGKALGIEGPEEASDPTQPGPNPLDPALAPPPPPSPEAPTLPDEPNDDDALVAGNAVDVIAAIDDETDLDALEAAEKDREAPRKGVLAAIKKARRDREA